MKALLSILLGFTVALGLVGTGIAGTLLLLSAAPAQEADVRQNVVQLWSAEPRRVDPGQQNFERLPSVFEEAGKPDGSARVEIVETLPADTVDTFTTAALPATGAADTHEASAADPYMNELLDSHIAWCADRYRSYSREDDSYTPYQGGRRLCVSPWSEERAAHADGGNALVELADGSERIVAASAVYADDGSAMSYEPRQTAMMSDTHVQECFSRYRSYRPEDNTYQPFGGGPRRLCQ